ncbi:toxin-antitoxin system YwqK family antitoxin [Pseudobacteriovorax antillogorgiicola]|uniref:toxin-antitoxin system YwqK family antitoxin n=1 Tax=Pseudobacteriovorax antillogorgiicola TaxID=1513793 RepID=UPI001A9F0239|nr:hypothetical protein [Pseudobacteriovorax antillogorgiicola]
MSTNLLGAVNGAKQTRNGYYLQPPLQLREAREVRTKFYPSGEIYEWSVLQKGQVLKRRLYWENGQIMAAFQYSNGLKHGLQREWYDNGKLSGQSEFALGKEVGWHKQWDEAGNLYVNYLVRNGRAFGLQNTRQCSTKL